ncbi:MAG: hypothetical protein GF398_08440 [Chitinivibrionales bacterium]|nr:hypothetical protein [Chitinivibrionales bacterium]
MISLYNTWGKRGKTSNLSVYSVLLLVMVFSMISVAQDTRCDLASKRVNNEYTCVKLKDIQNQTIKVPESVTRIPADGLLICPEIETDTTPVDIVFLMDQSGSMIPNSVAIANYDTSFCTSGCPNDVTIQIPYADSTKELPICPGCSGGAAGDPYGQRAKAIKAGIARMVELEPNSTVGFMDFGGQVGVRKGPRPLTDQSHLDYLERNIRVAFIGNTDWAGVLSQAKEWLQPTSPYHTGNERKAIVMVSDGGPGGNSRYLDVLKPTPENPIMPPVYGIFMGDENVDYSELQELSTSLTNGEFYLVPSDDPDSLKGAIFDILTKLSTKTGAVVSIENETNGQWSTTDTVAPVGDTIFPVQLDSIIALEEGKNTISMNVEFSDASTQEYSFTIEVTGDQTPDRFFDVECYSPSEVHVINENGTLVDSGVIDGTDDTLSLQLVVSPFPPLTKYNVPVELINSGDNETFVFGSIDAKGQRPSDNMQVFQKDEIPLSFINASSAPSPDKKIESFNQDTLKVQWHFPRDFRDTASTWVALVRTIYRADSAYIFDNSNDGRGDSIVIVYNLPFPENDTFKISDAYWNVRPSTNDSAYKRIPDYHVVNDDNRISFLFKDDNQFGKDLTGIDTINGQKPQAILTQLDPNNNPLADSRAFLIDRIGAVPTRAVLQLSAPTSSDNDILIITLSEPISPDPNTSDPWKKLIKSGSSNSYDDASTISDLPKPLIEGNTVTISFPKGTGPDRGSYLFLYGDGDASYTDAAGNAPGKKGIKISIASQLYFVDKKNPGKPIAKETWPTVQTLIAILETEATDPTLTLTITTDSGDVETFTMERDNNKYTAEVPVRFSARPASNSIVEGEIANIATKNEESFKGVVVSSDTATSTFTLDYDPGPAVKAALYVPGKLPGFTANSNADTLRLIFTEPVTFTSSDPGAFLDFLNLSDDNPTWSESFFKDFKIDNSRKTDTSIVLYIESPSNSQKIEPLKDSVQLRPGTPNVLDNNDNVPPIGFAVVVRWGIEPKAYVETVVDPATKELPPAWANAFSTPEYPVGLSGEVRAKIKKFTDNLEASPVGVPIQVTSPKELDVNTSEVTIYDAVGNILAEKMPLVREEDASTYTYYSAWNGRNQSGRYVGSGTYVAIINYYSKDGEIAHVLKTKIAVKKE